MTEPIISKKLASNQIKEFLATEQENEVITLDQGKVANHIQEIVTKITQREFKSSTVPVKEHATSIDSHQQTVADHAEIVTGIPEKEIKAAEPAKRFKVIEPEKQVMVVDQEEDQDQREITDIPETGYTYAEPLKECTAVSLEKEFVTAEPEQCLETAELKKIIITTGEQKRLKRKKKQFDKIGKGHKENAVVVNMVILTALKNKLT